MFGGEGELFFFLPDHASSSHPPSTLVFFSSRDLFADLVRKVVGLVHRGILRPAYGATVLHGCAALLGMDLASPLPGTAVCVRGLVKSNDLATAQGLMVGAFEGYGDVVDAAVTPLNRGAGFVRFAGEESVARVLQVHRSSEILIQDVAVRIVELNGGRG